MMANNIGFKKLLPIGAVFMMCWLGVAPAHAQIIVEDRDVKDQVEESGDEIIAAIEAANENRTDFEEGATTDYYADAIERLDTLIDALSHVDMEERDAEIFAELTNQDKAREDILAISTGVGSTFGLASISEKDFEDEDDTSDINAYLKRYGYLRPNQIFPLNEAFRNQLIDEHKALYFSDALVGAVDSSREARHNAYQALIVKAAATDDAHHALDINNALLIENGRNLALLIQLQAAQLSADTALLRAQTRSRESVSNIFGLRGATN